MKRNVARLLIGSAIIVAGPGVAQAQTTANPSPPIGNGVAQPVGDVPAGDDDQQVGDIIVTAQKREQSINKVGMAITAQTGDQLLDKGIRSVADLAKVVPGFTFEGAVGSAPIYSIRGIGFHDTSIASGQAVAVYADETPIPFGFETTGTDFDVERVEVLKGPQGTLFGQNSTGGAINYVMNKPTRDLNFGADLTYGRFGTSDISAFVSGPITDTLLARVAVRSIQGDGWQRRYGPLPANYPQSNNTLGKVNQLAARVLVDWRPTPELKVLLNVNTRHDRSETQAPQYINLRPSSSQPVVPEIRAFPYAPADDRAASWDPGIDYSQNNRWREANARIDYDLGDVTLTSISAYQKYRRFAPAREIDGTPYNALRYGFFGNVETVYQELRAAGTIRGLGSWLVGGNYEHDTTAETFTTFNPLATSRVLFGLPNTQTRQISNSKIRTYGLFGNVDYPVIDNLSLQVGGRYTDARRSVSGCSQDSGNGELAAVFVRLQTGLVASGVKTTPVVPIAPGQCVTLNAQNNPALFTGVLKENNFSWRVGLNWTVTPRTLVYANVSQGYKAGSYPLVAATSAVQFVPVGQEGLLAYEAGIKTRLASTLQVNASAFYYDYSDKQINGTYIDPSFGRLTRLITIPTSRVLGFEVAMDWRPFTGLTLSPSASYVQSRILGNFTNFTPLGTQQNFGGEPFPYSPRWQVNGNADYKWSVTNDWSAFVGGNVAYQSRTNGAFGQIPIYDLKPYALVDLRAGIESKSGAYRLSVWGSNVFNTYYWLTAGRSFDVDVRNTGQPARYGISLNYRFR